MTPIHYRRVSALVTGRLLTLSPRLTARGSSAPTAAPSPTAPTTVASPTPTTAAPSEASGTPTAVATEASPTASATPYPMASDTAQSTAPSPSGTVTPEPEPFSFECVDLVGQPVQGSERWTGPMCVDANGVPEVFSEQSHCKNGEDFFMGTDLWGYTGGVWATGSRHQRDVAFLQCR